MSNISQSDIIADLHTHSLVSKHAYSTIEENIKIAKERGIQYLAITDHFFGNGDDIEKKNEVARIQYGTKRLQEHEKDIGLLYTAEFNIFQMIENREKFKDLKFKPIGLHTWFVDFGKINFDDILNAFGVAIDFGHNAFCHIERDIYKLNTESRKMFGNVYKEKDFINLLCDIVDFAADNNILLEVNESSLLYKEMNSYSFVEPWLRRAKQKRAFIYLGSDAHYSKEVGKFNNSIELLNKIQYPKELIVNCNKFLLDELFK